MIKPTIGRVVHFRPGPQDEFLYKMVLSYVTTEPMAAIVAKVWSDRMVNLMVIDFEGQTHSRCTVQLVQPEDEKPDGQSFCLWMDYQVGQAAKTEQLQKQLDEK